MKIRKLRGFDRFRCLASDCPDTCCRSWRVDLDKEAAERYRALSGALGDELRALMDGDPDDPSLCLNGNFCPLLNDDRLCRIQLELGEEGLCESCRLHPRFAEEYGGTREWCVSLSCPEAVWLLFDDPEPLCYTEEVTNEPVSYMNNLDGQFFYDLLAARKLCFSLIQDRSFSIVERMGHMLEYTHEFQLSVLRHKERLSGITAAYSDRDRRFRGVRVNPQFLLGRLLDLKPLDPRWTETVEDAILCRKSDRLREAAMALVPDYESEHLLYYFLYRHFLKAVVDGRVFHRAQFAVFSVLCIRELEAARYCRTGSVSKEARVDLIHRYSREIEHDPEALNKLIASLRVFTCIHLSKP